MGDPNPELRPAAGEADAGDERRPRPKRASRRALRLRAAVAGAVAFALPWIAIAVVPRPSAAPSPAVVYVPAGSQVVVGSGQPGRSGVVVVTAKGSVAGPAPVAMTGGSHPAP